MCNAQWGRCFRLPTRKTLMRSRIMYIESEAGNSRAPQGAGEIESREEYWISGPQPLYQALRPLHNLKIAR